MTDYQQPDKEAVERLADELRRYAPPRIRDVQPPRIVDSNTPPLVAMSDSVEHAIMSAVAEAEQRAKRLHEQADHGLKYFRAWATEFASQYAQLLEQCTTLESTITDSIEKIRLIGNKPPGKSNNGHDDE